MLIFFLILTFINLDTQTIFFIYLSHEAPNYKNNEVSLINI